MSKNKDYSFDDFLLDQNILRSSEEVAMKRVRKFIKSQQDLCEEFSQVYHKNKKDLSE